MISSPAARYGSGSGGDDHVGSTDVQRDPFNYFIFNILYLILFHSRLAPSTKVCEIVGRVWV